MRTEQHGRRLDFRETRRPRTERAAHWQPRACRRQDAVVHLRTALRGASRLSPTVGATQGHPRTAQEPQAGRPQLPPEAGTAERPCHGTRDRHQPTALWRGSRHRLHTRGERPQTARRHEVRHTLHRRGRPSTRSRMLDSHPSREPRHLCRRPLSTAAHREEL